MFAQLLIYVFIGLITIIILWKWVIGPILKDTGIVDEDPIETSYTVQLENLQKELAEKAVSTNAAVECAKIKKQIKELEEKIAAAEAAAAEAE